ncbi:unnamed protein product [Peniophora sp. CBMAI 1063]|nr:unnamed protein product [Peniophora sp. CBMAI 1063]
MSDSCWKTYLERAASAPLTVKSRWHRTRDSRRHDVKANFQQIQHYDLQISPLDTEILDQALPEDAPNLHSLIVECDEDLMEYHERYGNEWSSSLNNFLFDLAPALQSLHLGLLQFPWGMHSTTLRVLRLSTYTYNHDISDDEMAHHEFDYVLETLRGMACLEVLELQGDILFRPPSHTPTPSVSSSLRELSLNGTMSRIGYVLAAYKASPNLYVQLISREHYDERDLEIIPETMEDWTSDCALAADILHSHLPSRHPEEPPYLTALQLVYRGVFYGISLRLGHVPFSPLDPYPKTTEERTTHPSLNIDVSPQKPHARDATSLHAKTLKLARGIPDTYVGHLRHLTLSGLYWPHNDVVAYFEHAKSVESLSMYAFAEFTGNDKMARNAASFLTSLICTMTAQSDVVPSEPHKPQLLPALRDLHISGISFAYEVEHDGRDTTLDTALTAGLTMRLQSGHGLETLQLEDCRDLERNVADLWASIVAQVTQTSKEE